MELCPKKRTRRGQKESPKLMARDRERRAVSSERLLLGAGQQSRETTPNDD